MSHTDTPTTPERDPDQLPKHTTPTWEVELLISGVAVFAMLQLPGWLDGQLFALMPRLDGDLAGMVQSLYMYLKSASLILAVTFALHLLLRAHWIALVGMHSVYPDGVQWTRLRMGPVQRELEQRRFGTAAESIDRADNRATVVFAIGVMLASRLLLIAVVVAVLFALLLAGTALLGLRVNLSLLFSACVASVVMLMLAARWIDRAVGDRLRPDGVPRRMLAAILRWLGRAGIGRRSEAMALLTSHGSERLVSVLIVITITVVFAAVAFGFSAIKTPTRAGSYALFPADAADTRSLRNAYYDDQRDPLHDPPTPFVQSAVVDGPYLRLTVPYQPQHDAAAVQRRCAGALAQPAGHARDDALLECLGQLHAVSLDGKPLATLHYDAGSDPRTERPALQAMIDVRSLENGRHLLRVERAPGNDGASGNDSNDDDVIVFWR